MDTNLNRGRIDEWQWYHFVEAALEITVRRRSESARDAIRLVI